MAVAEQHSKVVALEKARRLYSTITVLVVTAVIVAGYSQANAMNSGGFVRGLTQFFDYPGEIVREAWQAGFGFYALLIQFLPALVETLNIAAAATIIGGIVATALAFLSTRNLDVWPPIIPVVRRA